MRSKDRIPRYIATIDFNEAKMLRSPINLSDKDN